MYSDYVVIVIDVAIIIDTLMMMCKRERVKCYTV